MVCFAELVGIQGPAEVPGKDKNQYLWKFSSSHGENVI